MEQDSVIWLLVIQMMTLAPPLLKLPLAPLIQMPTMLLPILDRYAVTIVIFSKLIEAV